MGHRNVAEAGSHRLEQGLRLEGVFGTLSGSELDEELHEEVGLGMMAKWKSLEIQFSDCEGFYYAVCVFQKNL